MHNREFVSRQLCTMYQSISERPKFPLTFENHASQMKLLIILNSPDDIFTHRVTLLQTYPQLTELIPNTCGDIYHTTVIYSVNKFYARCNQLLMNEKIKNRMRILPRPEVCYPPFPLPNHKGVKRRDYSSSSHTRLTVLEAMQKPRGPVKGPSRS